MEKRGLSPVIATVLLVGLVIAISLIIFFWFRSFSEEAITKFENKNIKIVCADVAFEADYNNEILVVSNTGNVPIYDLNVRVSGGGSYTTENLKNPITINTSEWPSTGISQGQAFSTPITISDSTNELVLIPILLGETDEEEKIYECEDTYGYKLNI